MEKIIIGSVAKAQGLKGEVKIQPLTDNLDRFSELKSLFIDDMEYEIEYAKELVNGLFVKFCQVSDRTQAESLRGKKLTIPRQKAIALEEGRYFIVDLIGCDVYVGDNLCGKLKEILQNGSADVYVVKGEKSFMFPALKDVLLSVDIENKIIKLDAKRFEEIVVYED